MTSKHLFFRIMKEDLRHKIWMIALSVLGNFLLLPVAWLIVRNNVYGGPVTPRILGERETREFLAMIFDFFSGYLPVLGGVYSILSAFVAGLFSFRYVFHQNMVDSYHSMPVRRRTLYGACYLNGILIWFLPYILCLAATFCLAGSYVRQQAGTSQLVRLMGHTIVTLIITSVVYLLIYHLVLTAVMLCGNILNTLVSAGILGFGGFFICLMGNTFFMQYMRTFCADTLNMANAAYASPFISAPYLIFLWADGPESFRTLWIAAALNLGIALVLGGCAFWLYLKRESEMAGQGIRRKAVAALFRVICGVGAGMTGWMLFTMIVVYSAEGWGIFGAVLGAMLMFGTLDVIFRMDFKAFFAHKLQMALTIGLSLIVCFAFVRDWFGYDTYLPDREEIARVAIWDSNYANHYFSTDIRENFMERVNFQDMEIVYPYLERMVEHEREGFMAGDAYDGVLTKITLKNGSSYYRYYRAVKEDRELLWPMFMDERYLDYAYLIDEAVAANSDGFEIETGGGVQNISGNAEEVRQMLSPIAEAYNRDVQEDPESVMLGEGKLLATLAISFYYPDEKGDMRRDDIYMDVYEGMEHTIKALEQGGFGELLDAGERGVKSVELDLKYRYEDLTPQEALALDIEYHDGPMTNREAIILARASYGVYKDEKVTERDSGAYGRDTLHITDPGEVKELMALLSFRQPYRVGGVFRKDYVGVQITRDDGASEFWYIKKGDLPEKYILRFGEPIAE